MSECVIYHSQVTLREVTDNEITAKDNATVSRFVVNPNAPPSQVLIRTRPGVTNYYVYGLGLLYEVTETATNSYLRYYHYDYRGSTVALTDHESRVTDWFEYSAYGTLTYRTGNTDTPFLYNGRFGVQTDHNGLLYMRARYYNPYICRFINPDPIGFAGGLNWYAFADGNPVMYVDPEGHLAWFVTAGIGSGIGAIVGGVAAALDKDPRTTVLGGVVGGAVSGAIIGSGAGLLAAAGGTALSFTGAGVLAGSGAVGEFAGGTVQQRIEVATGHRSQVDYVQITWDAAISSITTPAFGVIGQGLGEVVQVAAGRSMASVIQKSTPVVAGFEAACDLPRASARLMMPYGDDVMRVQQTWQNIGIGLGIGVDDFYGAVITKVLQNQLPQPRTWLGTPISGPVK